MSDGKEQTEQYAELAKPWQPSEIGGIRLGDAVKLPSIEATFEVVAINDPLVTLRAPSGKEIRAGWQCLLKLPNTRNEQ